MPAPACGARADVVEDARDVGVVLATAAVEADRAIAVKDHGGRTPPAGTRVRSVRDESRVRFVTSELCNSLIIVLVLSVD